MVTRSPGSDLPRLVEDLQTMQWRVIKIDDDITFDDSDSVSGRILDDASDLGGLAPFGVRSSNHSDDRLVPRKSSPSLAGRHLIPTVTINIDWHVHVVGRFGSNATMDAY